MADYIGLKHILMHAIAAWGHNKPLIALGILVASTQKNVVVTIIASAGMFHKLSNERARLLKNRGNDPDVAARLHVVDVAGDVQREPFAPLLEFGPAYKSIYESGTVSCKITDRALTSLSPPSVIILDPFAEYAIEAIRDTSGKTIPVLSWMSGPVTAALRLFGPESLGGMGELESMIKEEMEKTGKTLMEVGGTVFRRTKGSILSVPGVPPLYDYEMFPQNMNIPFEFLFTRAGQRNLKDADGIIFVSTSEFDTDAVPAIASHQASNGKASFVIGPLALEEDKAQPPSADSSSEVAEFLDRIQTEYGEKSLLYISFGTIFWPTDPNKLYVVLDKLITSRQTPFILAHPSFLSQVPDDLLTRINESGIGLATKWAPQELILGHPATGWFITHGGWNSAQEAFLYRVPLIFWPFTADQPFNAAIMARKLNAAFELFEIRTDYGSRPPYAYTETSTPSPTYTTEAFLKEFDGLLRKLKGDEGQRVRENFERLCDKIADGWKDGGEAKANLDKLLATYV